MIKTSTKNEIVRYIYDDLSDSEKDRIQLQHFSDDSFVTELQEMRKMQRTLAKFSLHAPDSAVEAIMKEARRGTPESA